MRASVFSRHVVIGPDETASSCCVRRGLGWTLGKIYSPKGWSRLEKATQRSGGATIPESVPKMSGCGTL